MATAETEALAPILQALATMQSNVDRAQKRQANEYLEAFQKSVGPSQLLAFNSRTHPYTPCVLPNEKA
jgi:hypothetical protein